MIKIRSQHLFLFLYCLFIIYGSLFPLVGWNAPDQSLSEAWRQSLGRHISRSDLLTNFMVYIPFGFLLSSVWSGRSGNGGRVAVTVLLGSVLSFSLEYIQLYLPARTSSPVDLLLNVLSTLSGALLFCWVGAGSCFGVWLGELRHNRFMRGSTTGIGLLVMALWGAAQLAPFVPSLDVGDLKNGLKPLWLTLRDLSRFNDARAVAYALNISSLGAILLLIMKLRNKVPVWLGLYCGMVLLMKISIAGRQLSLEALTGLVVGIFVTVGFCRLPKGGVTVAGIFSVAAALIVEGLRSDLTTVELHSFNWIPFNSQMMENVSGIGSIIDGMWPSAALGFFALVHASSGRKINVFLCGLVLAGGVFVLEYSQSFIAGRYPDITPVILAVVGWSIPLLVYRESKS